MRDGPSPAALSVLVLGAGTGSLATEIAASRLIAPYFGSSTIVWANLIGIVLAALSVGYWLGGRLADRRPSAQLLGRILLVSAVYVAVTPFVAKPLLDLTVEGLDDASIGAIVGSFVAILLLFAPAVVLLGMVSPFAIRLALDRVEDAGAVAGRFYALSTVGSLVGTFASALVLIPFVGTQRTLLLVAAVLALSGSLVLRRRWLAVSAALAALVALPPGAIKAEDGLLHEEHSLYQYVQVVEQDDGRRLLRLNEGIAVHSVWRRDTVLTGGVWDALLAVPLLQERTARVAVLGNAGGTVARAFGVYWPRAEIDAVEIDPVVTDLAYRYFGLGDNPRVTAYDEDARPFLRRVDTRYDLVYVDAYHQPYVPFYLATREFFELVRERLAPGGLVALNVATVPDDDTLVRGIAGTLASVFPTVRTWRALRFNHVVIGFAGSDPGRLRTAPPADLAPLAALLRRDLWSRDAVAPAGEPWTDDRAPVEWVTDRMIVEFGASGGDLDEDYLPTRP